VRIESILVLALAVGLGGVLGLSPVLSGGSPSAKEATSVSGCSVTDGDTIRCGEERIRLLGIDAPEKPGSCRQGRVCAPGDYGASTASLERALSPSMSITRVGEDRYGRTLAMVAGDQGDLSCWQLGRGQAIYKARWDNGLRVARTCPGSTL
jgi:endonuclease YncB( thermonuclease family)